jgi:hypothetical protein
LNFFLFDDDERDEEVVAVRDDDDEVDELCILRIQNFDEQQFPL